MTQTPRQPSAVRAGRLLPMTPDGAVINDGALILDGNRILAAGPAASTLKGFSGRVRDLGEAVLVPGLCNMHNHLELSHVKGLPPKGKGFSEWVAWLIKQPLQFLTEDAVAAAVREMRETGTVFTADIASRNPGMIARACAREGLDILHFIEFFGFSAPKDGVLDWPKAASQPPLDPALPNFAAAGHALYSTHPETLRLAKAWDAARGRVFSLHLAEHQGETEMLASGTGAFADLLKVRVVPKTYAPPGLSPVMTAASLGLLDEKTLAAHCVRLDGRDIAALAGSGASVCLCPRSNAYIGVGQAPAGALKKAGLNLCLGTDSLASNDDLDLWNEVRHLLEHDAGLTLRDCLKAMTVNPARLLGREGELGVLAPGAVGGYAVMPPDLSSLPLD